MAEEGRFELPVPAKARWFSRPVHSTTLPLLLQASVVKGLGILKRSAAMQIISFWLLLSDPLTIGG
tara:strand:- start:1062 stop:1259 length:198 start_codon:yes stop_codon:yes gene_type:complete